MKRNFRWYTLVCFVVSTGTMVIHNTKAQDAKVETNQQEKIVKYAHLSPSWYPQVADKLDQDISSYLSFAMKFFPVTCTPEHISSLIVPHAGYAFSGICAAAGYQTLVEKKNENIWEKNTKIKRVIILAPSHYEHFYGIALPSFDEYKTALGSCPVDTKTIEHLAKHHMFVKNNAAYAKEHSLEIQLPFLQKVVHQFTIVPLVIGHISSKDADLVADVLKRVVDLETLIVVSSDFIHHGPSYDYVLFNRHKINQIKQLDSASIEAIMRKSFSDFERVISRTRSNGGKDMNICGSTPIKVLLRLLSLNTQAPLNSHLCCYYTSAHMQKMKAQGSQNPFDLIGSLDDSLAENSVSYASILFTRATQQPLAQHSELTHYEQCALLNLARETLQNKFYYNNGSAQWVEESLLFPIKSTGMTLPRGIFVTLNDKNGKLRGCIGRIVASSPLYETVAHVAQQAAFQDSRFTPLQEKELPSTSLKISVLGTPTPASYKDIVLGKHGVILKKGVKSAVYLPSVAQEQGWDLATMLSNLSEKAQLSADAWKSEASFEVFESFELDEKKLTS